MPWWGTLLGGTLGYMFGGPLGALLGAALGRNFDRGIKITDQQGTFGAGQQERVQAAFFTTTFSVMGHIAKADGKVTRDEIAAAESLSFRVAVTESLSFRIAAASACKAAPSRVGPSLKRTRGRFAARPSTCYAPRNACP